MSVPSLVGRYEYTEGTSSKFWTIRKRGPDQYEAQWGRIGRPPQGGATYDTFKAAKKINDKISKGYVRVAETERDERLFADFGFNSKPEPKPEPADMQWLEDLNQLARLK